MVSRVLRSKKAARAVYDRLSPIYAALTSSERPLRRRAVALLGPLRGKLALEIGFGPGNSLVEMARGGARVWGSDLSAGMARVASDRLRAAGFAGQAGLCTGDAVSLPYPAGVFDAILMSFTLELFDTPEIPLVLAECRRVLAPGGRLCIAAMARTPRQNAMVRAYEWFHKRFPAWVDCRPIPVREMLEEAGFEIREEWRGSTWRLPVAVVVTGPG